MKCSSCGTAIEASSAFYGPAGMVCGLCNQRSTEASQDAAAADQASSANFGGGLDGDFRRSETTTRVDADGNVHTTTKTTTVQLGLLGAVIKGVMGLFGR